MVHVSRLEQVTPDQVDQLNQLREQLSPGSALLTIFDFQAALDSSTRLYVVEDGQRLVGMAMLGLMQFPEGLFGRLEKVVIDRDYRGQGLSKLLLQEMIVSRPPGLRYIECTSRMERIAAQRLYQEMGFVRRETDTFRISF